MDPLETALDIEMKTRMEVSRTISLIENALAQWDALERKPQGLGEELLRLRYSLRMLEDWEKKSLSGMNDLGSVEGRLRSFVMMQAKLKKRRSD